MSRNLAHASFFATKTNNALVVTKQKAAAIIVLLLFNENKQINEQTNKQTNQKLLCLGEGVGCKKGYIQGDL